MEMAMNAVERVEEYSHLDQEPPSVLENRPPLNWPMFGRVSIENVSIRYAADLPDVLKNISFQIYEREKLGVIGRTGAGKSTLAMAFFRILPFSSGSIILDDIDICKIGLFDLRSNLTFIPQDPVLFDG
jgi:ABC-type multidrug transport system fused ATPase/permease subunit